MNKIVMVILSSIILVRAEQISINGIVKKSGSTDGLAGVRVGLLKIPNLYDTTDANGKFTISGNTAVKRVKSDFSKVSFYLRGREIVFTGFQEDKTLIGNVNIFSIKGDRIFYSDIFNSSQQLSISFPKFSDGIGIIRINLNGKVLTGKIAVVGDEIFLKGIEKLKTIEDGRANMTGADPIIDTLIASKTGFKTKKIPIDSYEKSDINIELDSMGGGSGKCSREELQEILNSYIAALESGDPTKMALASDAKYVENMKNSSFDKGIWKTKIKVSFHRDFFDVDSCSAFIEIMDSVTLPSGYNIGAQIRTSGGKIIEISALVADSGDWLIKGRSDIAKMARISSGEKWTIIPADKRDSREIIKAAGDAYLDCFLDSNSVTVPWGTPCARLEGAAYTGNASNPGGCNVGIPQGLKITDRRYVIDVEMGSVDIFCKFGGGMPDSHLFRVENGKLRYVHTISIQN